MTYRLSEYKLVQIPGDSEGQVNLTYYSPLCCKELDTIEQLTQNSKLFFSAVFDSR